MISVIKTDGYGHGALQIARDDGGLGTIYGAMRLLRWMRQLCFAQKGFKSRSWCSDASFQISTWRC